MAFGLLPTGFAKKRTEDIKAEIESSLRAGLGTSINLLPQSVLGNLVGIFTERDSLLWELAEAVYNSQYPDTAGDTSLDNAVRLTGVTREEATFSTVTMRIFGTLSTVVSAGFMASVTGVTGTRFLSLSSGTIGVGIDEIQLISFSEVPSSGNFTLVFDGQSTTPLAFNASTGAIQTALNNLTNLSGVVVAGSFLSGFTVTFSGADGQIDQPMLSVTANTLTGVGAVTVSFSEQQKGYGPFVDLEARAETAGVFVALAGTLTTVETPTFGVTGVTNLLDAVVGRNRETDADLRLRRLENLQRAGTASVEGIRSALLAIDQVTQALVVENTSTVVDGGGRPGKSFEAFVSGGTDANIRAAIWAAKPAGIETFGTVVGTITDSQGFVQTIKFSRPTVTNIWLIVTILENANPAEGAVYPANGDDLVLEALLTYGAGLTIGQDVVTSRLFTPINTVPGVIGIDIKVGTAPAPTLSANIPIAATALASFDSTRISIVSAP